MEKWLKIFNGDTTVGSEEIYSQIQILERKREKALSEIQVQKKELKTRRMLSLGMGEKKISNEGDRLPELKAELEGLSEAIKGLKNIFSRTVDREIKEEIKSIDFDLSELEAEKKVAEKRFIELYAQVVGLWERLYGRLPGLGQQGERFFLNGGDLRLICFRLAAISHTGINFWLDEYLDDLEEWITAANETFENF